MLQVFSNLQHLAVGDVIVLDRIQFLQRPMRRGPADGASLYPAKTASLRRDAVNPRFWPHDRANDKHRIHEL